jgi:hypothetical protein
VIFDKKAMGSNSVNLIRKKVQIQETVQSEKDWYTLFNVLIICLVVSLAIVTSLFRLSLKSDLEEKQSLLATNINTNLNTASKESLKQSINTLEDKYSVFKDFKNQNIDVYKINDEILKIYPNIKIDKFTIRPDNEFIEISLHIKEKGYIEFPKFLNALKKNENFSAAQIRNVTFTKINSTTETNNLINNLNSPETFITQVNLFLDKSNLVGENNKESVN